MFIVRILSATLLALLLSTAVYAQAAQNTITFTDNSNGEIGFDLFRCSGAACPPTVKLVTVPISPVTAPTTVTFFDNSVIEGNIYCYKVQAVGSSTVSAFSNTGCNVTAIPINAPTNLLVK